MGTAGKSSPPEVRGRNLCTAGLTNSGSSAGSVGLCGTAARLLHVGLLCLCM
jgi:hypothetical protein